MIKPDLYTHKKNTLFTKKSASVFRRWILTGTSHTLPFLAAGSILYSLTYLYPLPEALSRQLMAIGETGILLFPCILGGFIAYAMADKAGLAPGIISAGIASGAGGGMIGGLVTGFVAGAVVILLKKIRLPIELKSLGAIFLYPLIGSLIAGLITLWALAQPCAYLMRALTLQLQSAGIFEKIVLGAVLGAMTAYDMGGPVNKIATLFAQLQIITLPWLMGGVAIAITTPPLGMALACALAPGKYTQEEKRLKKPAVLMGLVGISEGALPYASQDPKAVIPAVVAGGVSGNICAFLLGVINHAPWGGLIVLPVVEKIPQYLLSLVLGVIVTAAVANLLKKELPEKEEKDRLMNLNFEEF